MRFDVGVRTLVATVLLAGWLSHSEAESRTVLQLAAVSEIAGLRNRVENSGFEKGAANWAFYDAGFAVDETEGRSGARSIRATLEGGVAGGGAYQEIVLAQDRPRPIVFSASSKAAGVTGRPDADYSLWLDLRYADGSWYFGLARPFAAGTHDWQAVDGSFIPEKALDRVIVYLLFRGSHTGKVWFDDVVVAEIGDQVVLFDATPVQPRAAGPAGCGGTNMLEAATDDGLRVGFLEADGSIARLEAAGRNWAYCRPEMVSGFFVRDVAENSDFVRLEPAVEVSGNKLTLRQEDGPLALSFEATVAQQQGRLEVEVTLRNRALGPDRATTLYFALPVDAEGWTWWDDLRHGRTVQDPVEFRNTIPVAWGAAGAYSAHTFASLTGPIGLTLSYPMDSPAPLRFAYNNAVKAFYVAFDLALTKETTKFPDQATVRFSIYQHEPEWGSRSALAKYMALYPQFFEKRAKDEGIWVAFDSFENIPHLSDFGIQFHEAAALDKVAFDQQAGISTLRYLSEPWSYWMAMPPELDHADPETVTGFLERQAKEGAGTERLRAQAALTSGVFYRGERLLFWPQQQPWMRYGAVVVTNANPDIGGSLLNKGRLDWNNAAKQIYQGFHPNGAPAGEYIDSFEATGVLLDHRRSHFAASSFPLSYSKESPRVAGVPLIFSAYEFSRWVGEELHTQFGKLLMANGALNQMAFYAHVFDVLGAEINWVREGKWTPENDAALLFRRMYAGRKPYLLLMNTDFSQFTPPMVEQYFETALFYAMYPSMFSADASSSTYWSNPALYERDRPLFRRYIPWIRKLSKAGWQPITGARASDGQILVERYGQGEEAIFTVRNSDSRRIDFRLEVDPSTIGVGLQVPLAAMEWAGGIRQNLESDGKKIVLTGALAPGQTQCWQLRRRDSGRQ